MGNQIGPRQFEFPPKRSGRRLRRLVGHAVLDAVDVEHVGMIAMVPGQRADPVGREELRSSSM